MTLLLEVEVYIQYENHEVLNRWDLSKLMKCQDGLFRGDDRNESVRVVHREHGRCVTRPFIFCFSFNPADRDTIS